MGAWDTPPTAAELAQAKSPWSDPPTDAEMGKVGASESAARGGLQGLSFGWGDEGAAAIAAALPFTDREAVGAGKTLGERYRAARDFYRGKNRAAKAANPKTYVAGEIGGAIPTALVPLGTVAKGASLATKIGQGAKVGAGLGALSGAGGSEAGTASGVAADASLGAALGAGVGGAVPAALEGVRAAAGPLTARLREAAINQGRKALSGIGTPLSARKPIAEEAVQQALDSGAIRPLSSVTSIAERLEGQADTLGAQYGRILDDLEAAGVKGPNAVLLARKLAADARAAASTSLGSQRPTMLMAAARELPGKVSSKPFASKDLGLRQAEEIKRGLQSEAKREYDKVTRQYTTAGETKKELAAVMREAIEDAVDQQAARAPQAAAEFRPVKAKLSRTLEALKAAEEGAGKAARRKPISLSSTIAGGAAAAVNPWMAVPTALAHGFVDQRLPSTLATMANRTAGLTSRLGGAPPALLTDEGARLAALIAALERQSGPRLAPAVAEEDR